MEQRIKELKALIASQEKYNNFFSSKILDYNTLQTNLSTLQKPTITAIEKLTTQKTPETGDITKFFLNEKIIPFIPEYSIENINTSGKLTSTIIPKFTKLDIMGIDKVKSFMEINLKENKIHLFTNTEDNINYFLFKSEVIPYTDGIFRLIIGNIDGKETPEEMETYLKLISPIPTNCEYTNKLKKKFGRVDTGKEIRTKEKTEKISIAQQESEPEDTNEEKPLNTTKELLIIFNKDNLTPYDFKFSTSKKLTESTTPEVFKKTINGKEFKLMKFPNNVNDIYFYKRDNYGYYHDGKRSYALDNNLIDIILGNIEKLTDQEIKKNIATYANLVKPPVDDAYFASLKEIKGKGLKKTHKGDKKATSAKKAQNKPHGRNNPIALFEKLTLLISAVKSGHNNLSSEIKSLCKKLKSQGLLSDIIYKKYKTKYFKKT